VDIPVTTSKFGMVPFFVQPTRRPVPKAPRLPPPVSVKMSKATEVFVSLYLAAF